MTWKTHKHGAFTSTIILYPIVLKDLWLLGYDKLHYTILCIAMYVLVYNGAQYGTAFPDFDHGNIESIPLKNGFTRTINHLIHTLLGKVIHRSWQTHSMDLHLLFVGLPAYLIHKLYLETGDIIIYIGYALLTGFLLGALIHCFMDMFTTEGVWLSFILALILAKLMNKKVTDFRLKLAPIWFCYPKVVFINRMGEPTILPRLRMYHPIRDVSTGSDWEKHFRNFVFKLNRVFMIISIIFYAKGLFIGLEVPNTLSDLYIFELLRAWVDNAKALVDNLYIQILQKLGGS